MGFEHKDDARHAGELMEAVFNSDVRQLCKAVAEEKDPERMKALLDQLAQMLDERRLVALLL